ncbi:MAG: hypothetical protein AAF196_19790 [Planctomycetota bacterium]
MPDKSFVCKLAKECSEIGVATTDHFAELTLRDRTTREAKLS